MCWERAWTPCWIRNAVLGSGEETAVMGFTGAPGVHINHACLSLLTRETYLTNGLICWPSAVERTPRIVYFLFFFCRAFGEDSPIFIGFLFVQNNESVIITPFCNMDTPVYYCYTLHYTCSIQILHFSLKANHVGERCQLWHNFWACSVPGLLIEPLLCVYLSSLKWVKGHVAVTWQQSFSTTVKQQSVRLLGLNQACDALVQSQSHHM